VGAGAIVSIGRIQRLIKHKTFVWGMAFCLVGLFVALGRNGWIILVVALPAYVTLKFNLLRSAPALCVVAVATFFIATTGSQFLVDNYSVSYSRFADPLENRYASIGTLHDRAITYDLMAKALDRFPLVGEGFSAKMRGSRAMDEVEWLASHNMVVDGVVYWGAAGALVYLVFLFSWFKQSTDSIALACDRRTRQIVMLSIAYVIGATAEGQFSGLPSLPFEFYFIAGFISGLYVEVGHKKVRYTWSAAGPALVSGTPLSPIGERVLWRSHRLRVTHGSRI
jgi:hypothetical protein